MFSAQNTQKSSLFRDKMLPTLKRNLVIDESNFERNKSRHL